jgi:non-specific serine/threonine protein kinase/serine/threonine-protein kinase
MDVDTRSDIYSLGVLLYELLTGSTPIPKQEFRNAAIDKILMMVRENDPPKPSTRINNSAETIGVISQHRKTEPKKLGTLIRGDLDWIVMKALEKDRTRRYQTANEFAEDMMRFLASDPVLAGPPSASYRLSKIMRKHRVAIVTTGIVGSLLLGSTLASTLMYFKANQARIAESVARNQSDQATQLATQRLRAEEAAKLRAEGAEAEARQQAEIATAVTAFLTDDLLGQADPGATPERDVTLRTVLDRASTEIQGQFVDQPLIEVAVRRTIGNTYLGLGEFEQAEPHLERSMQLCKRVLGEEHPGTLTSMNELAELYRHQGRYAAAEPMYKHALQTREKILGEEHPDTLTSMNNLGLLYEVQGRYAETELLFKQTIERQKRVLGVEHPETLTSMHNLAWLYASEGRHADAESLHMQTLETRKRVLGDEHLHTLYSMNSLAELYRAQGRNAEAEPLYLQTLNRRKQVLGEAHPDTLVSMNNLALLYLAQGRYADAEPLLKQALESQRRRLGEEHLETLTSMNNLAVVYDRQDRLAEAEALTKQTLEMRQRVLGNEHPHTLYSMNNLASLYVAQERYSEAEALASQTFQVRTTKLGESHPQTQNTLRLLCAVLVEMERYSEALPLCQSAVAWARANPDENWALPHAQTLLGMTQAGLEEFNEAERLLLEGYEELSRNAIKSPRNRLIGRARRSALKHLIKLYKAQEKPAEVQRWQTELQRLINETNETNVRPPADSAAQPQRGSRGL